MKKPITLLATLLLLSLVLLPPVAGMMAENRITARLSEASDNGFVNFSLRDYESGWLSSSGHIEVRFSEEYLESLTEMTANGADANQDEIADSLAELLDETLVLDVELRHGPVVLDDGPFLGWSTVVVQFNPNSEDLVALRDELGVPYFLKIQAETGFDGTTVFSGDVPPASYLNEVGDFRFSGFLFNGDFDGVTLNSYGVLDAFEIYGPAISFNLEKLEINGKQEIFQPYLWLGTTDASIKSIAMESAPGPEQQKLDITNLTLASAVTLNDNPELVDLSIDYQVESITGPDIDLTELNTGIKFRQIDIESLEQYYELNRELVLTDPVAMEERMPEIESMLHKALSSSPTVALEPFAFKWQQDSFSASARLNIRGDKLPPVQNWDPRDTQVWINYVSLQADADIARNLAIELAAQSLAVQLLQQSTEANPISPEEAQAAARKQAPGMLDVFTLQGLLTKTDDGYAATISFEDNLLMVNGKPIPMGAGQ